MTLSDGTRSGQGREYPQTDHQIMLEADQWDSVLSRARGNGKYPRPSPHKATSPAGASPIRKVKRRKRGAQSAQVVQFVSVGICGNQAIGVRARATVRTRP